MADKLKAIGVLNSLQIESVNKLKDENENLKKKNDRLIKSNDLCLKANEEWAKNGEEWKKNGEKNKRTIEELETKLAVLKEKNKDQKFVIEELMTKIEGNEIEDFKKKYQNALNEILKLAKLIRIYGKYKQFKIAKNSLFLSRKYQ